MSALTAVLHAAWFGRLAAVTARAKLPELAVHVVCSEGLMQPKRHLFHALGTHTRTSPKRCRRSSGNTARRSCDGAIESASAQISRSLDS